MSPDEIIPKEEPTEEPAPEFIRCVPIPTMTTKEAIEFEEEMENNNNGGEEA